MVNGNIWMGTYTYVLFCSFYSCDWSESHIELKVKKILKTEESETRFGHYVYFKGEDNGNYTGEK